MWNVYILRSSVDNNLYVGSTGNVKRRFIQHNAGLVDATKSRTPLTLEAFIGVKGKSKAVELERYFKTGSGRAVLNKRIL